VKKLNRYLQCIALTSVLFAGQALAAEKTIDVFKLNDNASTKGVGEKIGTITFKDTAKGLEIHPHLQGLPPGDHGFHVHQNPSCEGEQKGDKWEAGAGAGDHLDPEHTGKHLGPNGHGHLGDLPVLVVNNKGIADKRVVAERLKLSEIEGRSVVIHEHGDNYSDKPKPMGGGGPRIACGVIK
jgi:Cu-Zn family superoxide dismutase